MTPLDWLHAQHPAALVLWTLALLLVAFALADTPLLGLDPATLAILAAVFAALTATYQGRADDTG